MFLDAFHSVVDGWVRISAAQASRFAKEVAGDYNPIHDEDARRFCVPGDLLFALVLAYCGLYERMTFRFRGMVGDDVPLRFTDTGGSVLEITDMAGKVYLQVERDGASTHDATAVEAFTRRYVSFSGRNFPHFLKPLMADKGVMFNPDRPMVIYDSMGFELDRLDFADPDMALSDSSLEVVGKRAEARLYFTITSAGAALGSGSKKLVVSGLQAYDETRMQAAVAEYERLRDAYAQAR